MKKTGILTLAIIGILGLTVSAQAQSNVKKIAFVDLTKLFDNYEKTKASDTVLEQAYNTYQTELNAKIEKLQEAQGKLALLKEDEKAKMQKDIDTMKTDLQDFDQAKRTDLTKQRDEKIREILLEIEKKVSDYAKKENYDLILNDRVLIYGAETLDITEQILILLNGKASTTTPTAAPTTTTTK